jgi:pimeloyl-ACP methyl ester carboxylesterase
MVKENFIQVDGNTIRYLESGDSKKTLVLIHGLGASAERWNKVIPLFAKDYHVIVPDLIGFGYSDKPLVDYTPDFFSEFISAFLELLNLKRPSIVGSSLGGQITAEYASANSNNIEKLILVSPAGMMKQSTPALDAYIMAALYPNEQSAKSAFELMEGSGKSVDNKIVQGFIERMHLPNAKLAFMSTILGLKNSDSIMDKLHSIHSPTLLIWGSADPVIPIQHAEGFVSSIAGCKFYKMNGCGHTPYVQEPDLFASIVLKFLSE